MANKSLQKARAAYSKNQNTKYSFDKKGNRTEKKKKKKEKKAVASHYEQVRKKTETTGKQGEKNRKNASVKKAVGSVKKSYESNVKKAQSSVQSGKKTTSGAHWGNVSNTAQSSKIDTKSKGTIGGAKTAVTNTAKKAWKAVDLHQEDTAYSAARNIERKKGESYGDYIRRKYEATKDYNANGVKRQETKTKTGYTDEDRNKISTQVEEQLLKNYNEKGTRVKTFYDQWDAKGGLGDQFKDINGREATEEEKKEYYKKYWKPDYNEQVKKLAKEQADQYAKEEAPDVLYSKELSQNESAALRIFSKNIGKKKDGETIANSALKSLGALRYTKDDLGKKKPDGTKVTKKDLGKVKTDKKGNIQYQKVEARDYKGNVIKDENGKPVMVDRNVAEEVGSLTAAGANKGKFAVGFMQGSGVNNVLQSGVGEYNNAAKKVLTDVSESGAFNAGYMGGVMAQFMGTGTAKVAEGLMEQSAKAATKSGATKFAQNRLVELGLETPLNFADAVKMSTDADGKVNKKALAMYMGLNSGMTVGMGGAMEGIGLGLTKSNSKEFIRLQTKFNKLGKEGMTADELKRMNTLRGKLNDAGRQIALAKSNVANKANYDAVVAKKVFSETGSKDAAIKAMHGAGTNVEKLNYAKAISDKATAEFDDLRIKRENTLAKLADATPEEAVKIRKEAATIKAQMDEVANVANGAKRQLVVSEKRNRRALQDLTENVNKLSETTGMKYRVVNDKDMRKTITRQMEETAQALEAELPKATGKAREELIQKIEELRQGASDDVFYKGFYYKNAEGKTEILINSESPQAHQTVIGHETGHLIKSANEEEFQKLGEMLEDYARKDGTYDELAEQLRKSYPEADEADLSEEITCELLGRYVYGGDDKFIKKLIGENPSLVRRIVDYLKELFGGTADKEMAKELKAIINKTEGLVRGVESKANAETPKYAKNGGGKNPVKITKGMTEKQRATVLKTSAIEPAKVKSDAVSKMPKDIEALREANMGSAKKILRSIGDKFGIRDRSFYVASIDTDFKVNGKSLKESAQLQSDSSGDYIQLAKVFSCYENAVENAIPIEAHADRYIGTIREDTAHENTYVLLSAIEDENAVSPVELMVIERKGDAENRLHFTIVMDKIEKTALEKADSSPNGRSDASMLSQYSVPKLISKINPNDENFLKYVPDELLSKKQLASKGNALQKESSKLTEERRKTLKQINALKTDINNNANGNIRGKVSKLKELEERVERNRGDYEADGLLPPKSKASKEQKPPQGGSFNSPEMKFSIGRYDDMMYAAENGKPIKVTTIEEEVKRHLEDSQIKKGDGVKEEIETGLRELAELYRKGDTEELLKKADELARKTKTVDEDMDLGTFSGTDESKVSSEIKQHIFNTPISVRGQTGTINHILENVGYDKDTVGAKIKLRKNGGKSIDAMYQDLQEIAPERFPDTLSEEDQLKAIIDAAMESSHEVDSSWGRELTEEEIEEQWRWHRDDYIASAKLAVDSEKKIAEKEAAKAEPKSPYERPPEEEAALREMKEREDAATKADIEKEKKEFAEYKRNSKDYEPYQKYEDLEAERDKVIDGIDGTNATKEQEARLDEIQNEIDGLKKEVGAKSDEDFYNKRQDALGKLRRDFYEERGLFEKAKETPTAKPKTESKEAPKAENPKTETTMPEETGVKATQSYKTFMDSKYPSKPLKEKTNKLIEYGGDVEERLDEWNSLGKEIAANRAKANNSHTPENIAKYEAEIEKAETRQTVIAESIYRDLAEARKKAYKEGKWSAKDFDAVSTKEVQTAVENIGGVDTLAKDVKNAANKRIGGSTKKAQKFVDEEIKDYKTCLDNYLNGSVAKERDVQSARATALLDNISERLKTNPDDADAISDLMKVVGKMSEDNTLPSNVRSSAKTLAIATPKGRLGVAQKAVDDLNKRYGDRIEGKLELTDEERVKLATSEGDELEELFDSITQRLWDEIPATRIEKINEIRHMFMLTNVRTHARNMFGNVTFRGVRRAADDLEILLQDKVFRNAIEKRGGEVDRVKVSGKEIRKNKKFLNDEFHAIYDSSDSVNKYIETSRPDGVPIVKQKQLNWFIQGDYKALEWEDMITFKPAFRKSYMQYVKSKGWDIHSLSEAQKKMARERALFDAEYATFRDTSAFSRWVTGKKHELATKEGKTIWGTALYRTGNIALEGVLPFVKTPVNIFRRSVDFSPISLIRCMGELSSKDPEVFKQGIKHLSTGLTGTGIFGLGFYLSNAGFISIDTRLGDHSGSKYYDQDMGYQDYSLVINIGDYHKSWSIDWLQPVESSLFMGAAFRDMYDDMKTGDLNLGKDAISALFGVTSPMLDASFMSSAKDMMETFEQRAMRETDEGEPDMAGAFVQMLLGDMPKNYISSAIPQLVSQTANVTDKYQRDTRSTLEDPLAASWQSAGRQIINRIPVLRQKFLNPKLDRWGDDKKTGNNVATRTLNAMFNPSNVKEINENKYDRELFKIRNHLEKGSKDYKNFFYNFTGNPNYELANGKRMNYKDAYTYGKANRIEQTKIVQTMVDSPNYKEMTWGMKASEVDSAHWIGNMVADHDTYGINYALGAMKKSALQSDNSKNSRDGRDYKTYQKYVETAGKSRDKERFWQWRIEKEEMYARAHPSGDDTYRIKGLCAIETGDQNLVDAMKLEGSKEPELKHYWKLVQDGSKNKTEAKKIAFNEITDACCRVTSNLKHAKVDKDDLGTLSLSAGMSAKNGNKIDERVYRALGHTWNSAQAGGGLQLKYNKDGKYDLANLEALSERMNKKIDERADGQTQKDAVCDFIENDLGITNADEAACVYQVLYIKGNKTWKNPYKSEIDDHLEWKENNDEEWGVENKSSGGRGRRGHRRGGWGHGGGGSSGSGGAMPKTESGAFDGKVTNPFSTSNGSKASNLDEAYRKKAKKLRESSRKKIS